MVTVLEIVGGEVVFPLAPTPVAGRDAAPGVEGVQAGGGAEPEYTSAGWPVLISMFVVTD